jgi:hypothetical protein
MVARSQSKVPHAGARFPRSAGPVAAWISAVVCAASSACGDSTSGWGTGSNSSGSSGSGSGSSTSSSGSSSGASTGSSTSSSGTSSSTSGGSTSSSGSSTSSGSTGGSSGADGGSGGGSSGGDGGSGEGGSLEGGVHGCAGVTAAFCDDFESDGVGLAPMGMFNIQAAGSVVVDGTKPYGGTKSLHYKVPAGSSGTKTQLQFTSQFPLPSNDLHGRMMLYMSAVPGASTSDHWDMIESNNAGGTVWEVGGQYGNYELVVDPPDQGLDSKTPFPTGRWFCQQWEFKYPGAGQDTTYIVKVDGAPVDQGDFTGPDSHGLRWVAGAWNDLWIGWEGYGNSPVDLEFWIDDLAFGEQEIPCSIP